jgi:hypothetical protein
MPVTPIDVDVWVRGRQEAATRQISLPTAADQWTDADVRTLLTEMLRAIEREKNPDGDPPPVSLRGFSWIVSPYDSGGVMLHLEMMMGTVSAGPFAIDEGRLSAMVTRAMAAAPPASPTIH